MQMIEQAIEKVSVRGKKLLDAIPNSGPYQTSVGPIDLKTHVRGKQWSVGQWQGGIASEFGRGASRRRRQHCGLFQPARDRTQPVSDGQCPITLRGRTFGQCAVLGCIEFVAVEQRGLTVAAGSHGAAGKPPRPDGPGAAQPGAQADGGAAPRCARPPP